MEEKNSQILDIEMDEIGIIGSAFGFGSEFMKAYQESDSIAALLMNSSGWISSEKDLIVAMEGIDSVTDKSTLSPVANLLGMASYAAGNIIDLSTDGHPLTFDEAADLLLGTGLRGMKTGVSEITHGFVNIDVERSKNIFDKNTEWMTDKICSTGISVEGQVVLGLYATPVVAAMSVAETFVDIGWQLGDTIKGGINKIKDIW